MPEKQYGTILTQAGNAAIVNALLTGDKVNWTHICVGDGGGYDTIPDSNQKALKRMLWQGPISDITIAEGSENQLVIHGVIPTDVGGFWIREIGILDDDGNLVAVGNTPAQEKATGANKVVMDMDLYIHVLVSNANAVNVTVDPTVAIASKADLERLREEFMALIAGIEFEYLTDEEILTLTGASYGVGGYYGDALTDEEIEELVGEALRPTTILGDPIPTGDIEKLLDDDPANDPVYDEKDVGGAMSEEDIISLLLEGAREKA